MSVEGSGGGEAQLIFLPREMTRSRREREGIACNVDVTLEPLYRHEVERTFFILGAIA